jgi:hypothetical protein
MLAYQPGDAFWAIQAQLKAGTLKHLGTLSKAYERIGRIDESLFLLMNASSAADRRKQGASVIARQPELRARQKSSYTENPRNF